VAKRLGVSQATVLRAVARGTLIPAETTPGGHHRFRLEAVDALAGAPSPTLSGSVRLIGTSAAARLLGVSQHTVIRACHEGRLEPDETTPGGHHRFTEKRIRELAPHGGHLVSTGGAARAMGLTADKLRRAVHQGSVSPAAVTPGGHRRFDASQLASNGDGTRPVDEQGKGHG
jgi:excisionase family DNA binding protein